jgi:carbon storage regulator
MYKERRRHRQKERTMLVLARKQNERLFINGNIVVTVLSVQGSRVRLGIEAPAAVPVHRSEVYDAINSQEAQRKAG